MQNIVMENLIKCRKRGGAINSSKNVQASGYKNRPPLTYRVTQMLTGHGCSGEYLHRIRKKATVRYHHCDASVDLAQHTLEYCPA